MPDTSADEKILKSLEALLPKLTGAQRESAQYRINRLKEKIEKQDVQNKIRLCDVVTSYEFSQKVTRERNIIEGYVKLMSMDEQSRESLAEKKDFCEKKIALLNSEMKMIHTKEEEISERSLGKKINGSVKFNIRRFTCDPLFECESANFYIDSELRVSVDVREVAAGAAREITIGMQNSRDLEIILVGKSGVLLGLMFFSCEYLLSFREKKTVDFVFLENASLGCEVEFHREIRLIRKNAEIICVYRDGHALENFRAITPLYCAVCDTMSTLMDAYRCYRCKITTHKRCSNHILFSCPLAPELGGEKLVKRYNIPHVMEDESASGFRYCGQCGARIRLGGNCKKCTKCLKRFHCNCANFLPHACGIALDLRIKMTDFRPPPSDAEARPAQYDIGHFSLLKVLGRGAFGKVMLARKEKTYVAMKILKKEMVINSNNIRYLDLERHILKLVSRADHPFLMKMLYCFQDQQNVYFGTEFLAGGDLFHFASQRRFAPEQIKQYVCEIILGLEFLHAKNIIYRDMKLDNVLICADGHVKIADFGLCKENIGPESLTYTFCGTADTIAPEIILQGGYTKDADWWSFGVVMYEMYENEVPFNGSTTEEISSEILNHTPEFSRDTPRVAKELMMRLLEKNPQKRIGYGKGDGQAIRSHPYFDGVNWDDVVAKKIKPVFVPKSSLTDNFDDEFMGEPIVITPCNSFRNYDRFFINFN